MQACKYSFHHCMCVVYQQLYVLLKCLRANLTWLTYHEECDNKLYNVPVHISTFTPACFSHPCKSCYLIFMFIYKLNFRNPFKSRQNKWTQLVFISIFSGVGIIKITLSCCKEHLSWFVLVNISSPVSQFSDLSWVSDFVQTL